MTPEIRSVNFPEGADPASAPLSALAGRVLGCLVEKELATPEQYPLTLNALVNACNQRSNRDPWLSVGPREAEVALEELREKQLATFFAGADARVSKFKQRLDQVYPMDVISRALLGELLLRGPQTAAGLRGNTERLLPLPAVAEIEVILAELAARPSGALVRKLARQPGQKEPRWAQLLMGQPEVGSSADSAAPAKSLTVHLTMPPEVARRLGALETELAQMRAELAELRRALGG